MKTVGKFEKVSLNEFKNLSKRKFIQLLIRR